MKDAMAKRIEENGGHGVNLGRHYSDEVRKHMSDAQRKIADVHREHRSRQVMLPESYVKRTKNRLKKNNGIYNPNDPFAKKVLCVETGEIIFSIAELSRRLNITPYKVKKIINNHIVVDGKTYKFYEEDR